MKMSHHSVKQFPALAPGPPRTFAPQASTPVTKPKKNSTACLACKAAKRKCSGPDAPCKACRATNTHCHFDPSRDLRRKVAVKRTIYELTKYKDLFISFWGAIGSTEGEELNRIVELARSKASFEDLPLAVGGPDTEFEDPDQLSAASRLAIADYVEQPLGGSGQEKKRRTSSVGSGNTASSPERILTTQPTVAIPQRANVSPYARVSLESLCDIPLFEVPAKPWTQVTNDDYLVSHLVSLYFTWDHPCSQFLDQRTFLTHMKQGDSRSEFCTPLLVNSLLSLASTHSDSPEVLSSPENAFSRGQHFFDEAQRIWQANGSYSLPNIQALLLMCCVYKSQGYADRSWSTLGQAVLMAQELRLFDTPVLSRTEKLSEIERIRAITAWGIFNLSSQMSVEQRRISPLAYPTTDVTLCGKDDFDWTPYPRSNKITYHKKPARLPEVRQGLAEITKVLVDVRKLASDKSKGISFEELWKGAKGPFDRLTAWLQHWPTVSEIEQDPVPQVLVLRIKSLQAIITLFEAINDPNYPQFVQQARVYQIKSAHEIAQCLRVHRQAYDLKHIPSQMADAIQTGLWLLANQMEDSNESRQAFIELCRFGVALSHRFQQTANVVNEIRNSSLQQNIQLPTEALAILEDQGYES